MISLLVGRKDDQERKRECGEYIYLVGEMIKREKENVWELVDLVGRRECNAREEKRASYITYVGVRKMSK